MAERLTSVASFNHDEPINTDGTVGKRWGEGDPRDSVLKSSWAINSNPVDSDVSLNYGLFEFIATPVWLNVYSSRLQSYDHLDVSTNIILSSLEFLNVSTYFGSVIPNFASDYSVDHLFYDVLPKKDSPMSYDYHHVYRYDSRPIPPGDFRYSPTLDFNFRFETIKFTADFVEPIDLDSLKVRLSPVDSSTDFPWKKSKLIDILQDIKWGYSQNNFLIGGSVDTKYSIAPDATDPPVITPPEEEVITFVNIVNIVTLPERTAIQFDNFSLATDLDSVSWAFKMDVADQATLNLIKPSGGTVKELEVSINGELFSVFISKTKTQVSHGRKQITCTGWSHSKLLSHPYHARRSHVETSPATPAGILAGELLGTGFTGTWDSVSWVIPANTYTYIDKAPLAALSELIQSVGAVILPDVYNKRIVVKPRYPVSPWQWDITPPDISLNEAEFFSIDTEWVPQESPDSIYVYGEVGTGVAVKAVKLGTPGTKTLPTIIDKHITDTIAGTERGRIEVAKNGFKEVIPISTFVKPADGIMKPLQLVEVTEIDGITKWKAQVIGVTLDLKRQGNALIQSIQLERHYAAP